MHRGGRDSSRRRSPSYSPPPPRRSRQRSPSYSPPRSSNRRSPPNEPPRRDSYRSRSRDQRRTRSPSSGSRKAGGWGDEYEEDPGVSPPRGAPVQTLNSRLPKLKRSRSRSPAQRLQIPWEDEETLRSLNCKACAVFLHDRDSMLAHLKGAPHLSQQQRLRDREVRARTGGFGLNDVLRLDSSKMQYDDRFWVEQKSKEKKLRPEHERFLDTARFDNIPAKFDPNNYDHGQFKYKEKENYCEKCDVYTKTRDQMQAHKEGANHKKMSAKVQRFRCDLCLIDVPCRDTLDNHMRGKDHIKRVKQLEEQRREKGEVVDEDGGSGYRTGPREMAKLEQTEREELEQLRKTVKTLRDKVQEQNKKLAKCRQEHGTADMVELRKKVEWCKENHMRAVEFNRPGIFAKQEVKEEYGRSMASTSRGMVKPERPREEYVEDLKG